MQRVANLTYLTLGMVMVLVVTLLMVCVGAEAQIAFSSDRVGNPEIYVMDTDGRNQRRLTNHPARDNSPAWSPDGKRIAFVSRAFEFDGEVHFRGDGPSADIYVMGADGGNPQNLTVNGGSDYSPSWSPDGKRIAFSSDKAERWNYDIYVMDADGGNLQNLTNHPLADRYPSWSPDGKQIVFSARRFGHVETKFSITNEIYVMDADGGNQERLTENPRYDWDPVWSPNGRRIAFMADKKGDLQNFGIYVMDADGGNEQQLTDHQNWDSSPTWSPDSRRIAFVSDRDGNSEIYVMDANGGNLQNLTRTPHSDYSPAWLSSPLSVSRAGKKFTMWGWLKQVGR